MDALEALFFIFLETCSLCNCFKMIICTEYPGHVSITTLKNLTLYLEDRNNISDKVQKLNAHYSLMELRYIYIFFFSFFFLPQYLKCEHGVLRSETGWFPVNSPN